MLVAKDNLIIHNPTNRQLAQALQLKPSINVWRFITCKLSVDTLSMILDVLINTEKTWVELDYIDFNLRHVNCEVLHADYF